MPTGGMHRRRDYGRRCILSEIHIQRPGNLYERGDGNSPGILTPFEAPARHPQADTIAMPCHLQVFLSPSKMARRLITMASLGAMALAAPRSLPPQALVQLSKRETAYNASLPNITIFATVGTIAGSAGSQS